MLIVMPEAPACGTWTSLAPLVVIIGILRLMIMAVVFTLPVLLYKPLRRFVSRAVRAVRPLVAHMNAAMQPTPQESSSQEGSHSTAETECSELQDEPTLHGTGSVVTTQQNPLRAHGESAPLSTGMLTNVTDEHDGHSEKGEELWFSFVEAVTPSTEPRSVLTLRGSTQHCSDIKSPSSPIANPQVEAQHRGHVTNSDESGGDDKSGEDGEEDEDSSSQASSTSNLSSSGDGSNHNFRSSSSTTSSSGRTVDSRRDYDDDGGCALPTVPTVPTVPEPPTVESSMCPGPDARRVYVSKLPTDITTEHLRAHMSQLGEAPTEVKLLYNHFGKFLRCATCAYPTTDGAAKAVTRLPGTTLNGQTIYVRYDKEPTTFKTGKMPKGTNCWDFAHSQSSRSSSPTAAQVRNRSSIGRGKFGSKKRGPH